MLRNMLDWFLMRDLDRRRAAVQVENNDFLARLDDIERRSRRLADERDHLLAELRRQSDDELALSEQLLSGARAGDEESQSRLDAWMQGAAQRSRDRTAQADALTADAEALQAEAERLARDQARVRDESAVPAIGAGAGALVVLATHDSTPYTRFLTIWGLVATMASLIAYVVMHTASSTRN